MALLDAGWGKGYMGSIGFITNDLWSCCWSGRPDEIGREWGDVSVKLGTYMRAGIWEVWQARLSFHPKECAGRVPCACERGGVAGDCWRSTQGTT